MHLPVRMHMLQVHDTHGIKQFLLMVNNKKVQLNSWTNIYMNS